MNNRSYKLYSSIIQQNKIKNKKYIDWIPGTPHPKKSYRTTSKITSYMKTTNTSKVRTKGHSFSPFSKAFGKFQKRCFYQHICIGNGKKFENYSVEELRMADIANNHSNDGQSQYHKNTSNDGNISFCSITDFSNSTKNQNPSIFNTPKTTLKTNLNFYPCSERKNTRNEFRNEFRNDFNPNINQNKFNSNQFGFDFKQNKIQSTLKTNLDFYPCTDIIRNEFRNDFNPNMNQNKFGFNFNKNEIQNNLETNLYFNPCMDNVENKFRNVPNMNKTQNKFDGNSFGFNFTQNKMQNNLETNLEFNPCINNVLKENLNVAFNYGNDNENVSETFHPNTNDEFNLDQNQNYFQNNNYQNFDQIQAFSSSNTNIDGGNGNNFSFNVQQKTSVFCPNFKFNELQTVFESNNMLNMQETNEKIKYQCMREQRKRVSHMQPIINQRSSVICLQTKQKQKFSNFKNGKNGKQNRKSNGFQINHRYMNNNKYGIGGCLKNERKNDPLFNNFEYNLHEMKKMFNPKNANIVSLTPFKVRKHPSCEKDIGKKCWNGNRNEIRNGNGNGFGNKNGGYCG